MCPKEQDANGVNGRGVRDGEQRAALPPPIAGSDAAAEGPRTVTTGGKIENQEPEVLIPGLKGIDADTGEEFGVVLTKHGVRTRRQLTPDPLVSPAVALIDALAFSVVPPGDESTGWVMDQMRQFLPIDRVENRYGWSGFKESLRFGGGAGLIAWGGGSQRRRVYFSVQGQGCSMIKDWAGLSAWLRDHQANIKRLDLAHDDFEGKRANIAWALAEYQGDGFLTGGRGPKHQCHGDWLAGDASIHGRTLVVGSRKSGKCCRIYEKGKQLGKASSLWARVEVEWRGKDRVIPYEALTEPGKYLAGAYPCLAFLCVEQSSVKTIANSATISFAAAVGNAQQQVGKLVNLMTEVFGGDLGTVVALLRRDGIPARIEPYSYHLADAPERLDPDAPGSFAATGDLE